MIVPTGIGAEIGGHAGDANPAAKLLAGCCDNLITHPNVVNASCINEMTENTLYVEGSILDRFLEGYIGLKKVARNKILIVCNSFDDEIIEIGFKNSVNAARCTIGADIEVITLNTPLRMVSVLTDKGATGKVDGWEELVYQVKDYKFDALGVVTEVEIEDEVAFNYYKNGGLNPWGGVEAKASRLIAEKINKPVAHAPIDTPALKDVSDMLVGPRDAAEAISYDFLHCIVKGLNKAPRIVPNTVGLNCNDVDCLITPVGCVGPPHKSCMRKGIPIIAVKENKTCLNDPMPDEFILVENYWEAAGIIMCMKAGINPVTVRRIEL